MVSYRAIFSVTIRPPFAFFNDRTDVARSANLERNFGRSSNLAFAAFGLSEYIYDYIRTLNRIAQRKINTFNERLDDAVNVPANPERPDCIRSLKIRFRFGSPLHAFTAASAACSISCIPHVYFSYAQSTATTGPRTSTVRRT